MIIFGKVWGLLWIVGALGFFALDLYSDKTGKYRAFGYDIMEQYTNAFILGNLLSVAVLIIWFLTWHIWSW